MVIPEGRIIDHDRTEPALARPVLPVDSTLLARRLLFQPAANSPCIRCQQWRPHENGVPSMKRQPRMSVGALPPKVTGGSLPDVSARLRAGRASRGPGAASTCIVVPSKTVPSICSAHGPHSSRAQAQGARWGHGQRDWNEMGAGGQGQCGCAREDVPSLHHPAACRVGREGRQRDQDWDRVIVEVPESLRTGSD